MKKYFAIFAVVLLALVGCNKKNNGTSNASDIDGQWHIIEWNNETPEFDVYIEFKAGKFNIYQQVYSVFFEKFEGSYNVSNGVVTGTYTDGSNWACGYKFEVAGSELTLKSQEDTSIVSVYKKCTIPQSVIDEAAKTRASESKPLL